MPEFHLCWFERPGSVGLTISPWVRILSLGIGLLFLAASWTGGTPGIVGIILTVLFLLGSLYRERWNFEIGRVSFHLGLVGVAHSQLWSFDAIEGLSLARFRRGQVPGAVSDPQAVRRGRPQFAVLLIRFTDGTSRILDRRPIRQSPELERVGQRLSDATGLRLSRDTSW